ncbi:MAG: hypothetical protein FIA95_13645 [Gemmatimonadetes bacterium]|nr:hypothetical protein [Gemmatimonadota bacterium]
MVVSVRAREEARVIDNYFFALGVGNSALLILIFLLRKDHLPIVQSYGWAYLLLAVPAIHLLYLAQQDQKARPYTIFLLIFLAFIALEGLFDFVLRIPFRSDWRLLTPYLALYYAMNYGFIVMPWKASVGRGVFVLILFLVQLAANILTH